MWTPWEWLGVRPRSAQMTLQEMQQQFGVHQTPTITFEQLQQQYGVLPMQVPQAPMTEPEPEPLDVAYETAPPLLGPVHDELILGIGADELAQIVMAEREMFNWPAESPILEAQEGVTYAIASESFSQLPGVREISVPPPYSEYTITYDVIRILSVPILRLTPQSIRRNRTKLKNIYLTIPVSVKRLQALTFKRFYNSIMSFVEKMRRQYASAEMEINLYGVGILKINFVYKGSQMFG